MVWTAYGIIPIDYGWDNLPTVEEIAHRFAASDATLKLYGADYEPEVLVHFLKRFASAKDLATAEGWEGDYRGDSKPRVFFLPSEGDFEYGFVWKQDNNGTTFVVSPYPLPWLDQLS